MSPLRLNGSTSGFTTLDAPAVAGSNTLVLPTGNGTADQALVTNGTGTLSFADRGRMTLATAQNSTSGTSIDFTGIPSWVKRITVMLNGVSTNGSSVLQIQLGYSGGVETSGYTGSAVNIDTSIGGTGYSAGFLLCDTNSAASTYIGIATISLVSGNIWVFSSNGSLGSGSGNNVVGAGVKTTTGTLDRVRITTVNGTDTFDAGSINILYEG